MTDPQVEIAKEWLGKYYESAKAGRICAYTLKEYIQELEAENKRLKKICAKATDGGCPVNTERIKFVMSGLLNEVMEEELVAHKNLIAKLEAENAKLRAKIAEFIDGENHGETYPPEPGR